MRLNSALGKGPAGILHLPDEIVQAIFCFLGELSNGTPYPLVEPTAFDATVPAMQGEEPWRSEGSIVHSLGCKFAVGPRYTNEAALGATCRRFSHLYRTRYVKTIDLRLPQKIAWWSLSGEAQGSTCSIPPDARQLECLRDSAHTQDFMFLKRAIVRFVNVTNVVLVFSGSYPKSMWKQLAEIAGNRLKVIHLVDWVRTWRSVPALGKMWDVPFEYDSGWLNDIALLEPECLTVSGAIMEGSDLLCLSQCSTLRSLSLKGERDVSCVDMHDMHCLCCADDDSLSKNVEECFRALSHLRHLRLVSLSPYKSLDDVLRNVSNELETVDLDRMGSSLISPGAFLAKRYLRKIRLNGVVPRGSFQEGLPSGSLLSLNEGSRDGGDLLTQRQGLR